MCTLNIHCNFLDAFLSIPTNDVLYINNLKCRNRILLLLLCKLCKWLTKKVLFPFNDSLFMLRVELHLFLYVNYWKVLFKAEELIVYNQAMFFCCYFQIVALKTVTNSAVFLSSLCVLHMVKTCQCECNNSCYVLTYSHEGIWSCRLAGAFRICADYSESMGLSKNDSF